MSEILWICLYVLGGLSVLFLTFIAIKVGRSFYKVRNVVPVREELVENIDEIKDETEEDFEDETINPIEETVSENDEERVEETVKEELSVPSEPEKIQTEDEDLGVAVTKEEPSLETTTKEDDGINIGDIDETDELADKLNIKRVHFAQKLLKLDEYAMHAYDEIYNKFNSYRGVNSRLSFKHVTFRYKRKLIAKLTIKGKTLKLHLALLVDEFNKNVYFQTDMQSVKAYEEVPFTVKVKSARGLKNALNLIDALLKKEGVEPKSRYKRINALKEIMETFGIK